MIGTVEYFIPLGDKMDIEAEAKKISNELKYYRGFLLSVEKKLGNENFVKNAPEKILDMEKKKKNDAETKISSLENRLKEVGMS